MVCARALLAGLVTLVAVPAVALATGPADPDRLPAAPRCAEPGAVARLGSWASVRGPAFDERPLGQGQDVTAFVVSPHDQRRVYATNGTSVVRSDDGGCRWREVYVLPAVPTDEDPLSVAGSRISQLVVPDDVRARDRVLAVAQEQTGGGRPHLLLSEDGTDFQRRSSGLPATGFATDLVVAPSNADLVWLAVRFTAAAPPAAGPLPALPALPVPLPVPAPDPGTAPRGGLYASTNGGADFAARLDAEDPTVATGALDDLVTDPVAANQLWGVAGGVLRHSDDGGRTFRAAVPEPAEQRARGWSVTSLVVDAGPDRTRTVIAFTRTSAQGGGPRVLTSTDGGATFDEVAGPGPVDAAVLVGPERRTLAVSTAPAGDRAATVQVRVGGRFQDLTPLPARTRFALATDRTSRATLHAATPRALLRYVGPLVTPPPPAPPQVGGVVGDEDLPPLGDGRFEPAFDDVALGVGRSRTVEHQLALPRRGTPLDLFVVVDTTISMKDDLAKVTSDIRALTRRLAAQGVDLRVGLAEFKGQESGVGYRRVLGIGPDLAEFEAALTTLKGDGFGLEMQLIALEQALSGTGETAADLVPATCKAPEKSPDRFVLDEKRTAPPVQRGQAADFQPSHTKVVLVVTDTAFLRPAGTRLTRDCRVDTAGVAAEYARAGVFQVGVGVDDVDNPRTGEDLLVGARTTGAVQPSGPACSPELTDGRDPHPAVCRTATALEPTLLSLVARASEPAVVTVREQAASPAVALPALPRADLRRPTTLRVPVSYTCPAEPTTQQGRLEAVVEGATTEVVAELPWRLRCLPLAALPDEPLLPPAAPVVAVVGALPLVPAPGPPPPPPAQGVQTQPQTQPQTQAQAQVQAGAQEDEQLAVALALQLPGTEDDGQVELAMSARRDEAPAAAWLAGVTLVTAGAAGVAMRRRTAVRVAAQRSATRR